MNFRKTVGRLRHFFSKISELSPGEVDRNGPYGGLQFSWMEKT